MSTTAPAPDLASLVGAPHKRAALRRMKTVALAFLLFAAASYALTYLAEDGEQGWIGFVRAAAEAGVVGGLADWFAVTAIFRRPLGLPIPHTALIPTRKDALAGALGEFFTTNFVTPQNLRRHLAEAALVDRAATWLTVAGRPEGLVRRGLAELGAVRGLFRPQTVADVFLDVVRRDVGRRSYSEVAGVLMADFLETGQHRPVLDAALPYLSKGLQANRQIVHDYARQLVDEKAGIFSFLVSAKRIDEVIDGLQQQLLRMESDRAHPLREALDRLFVQVAYDLQHEPELRTSVDSVVLRFLADPQTRRWWVKVAEGALAAVQSAVEDPDGPFAEAVTRALTDVGLRAQRDPAFRGHLEQGLQDLVVHLVTEYGTEVSVLIERTVKDWDGADAADKIELAAGRDLQFIRINGTVIGALAGVAIHAVAITLS